MPCFCSGACRKPPYECPNREISLPGKLPDSQIKDRQSLEDVMDLLRQRADEHKEVNFPLTPWQIQEKEIADRVMIGSNAWICPKCRGGMSPSTDRCPCTPLPYSLQVIF